MSPDQRSQRHPLVRVPAPERMEAPSSWLSRVALSQGCVMRDLLLHLRLPQRNLETAFAKSKRVEHIERLAGVSLEPLQVSIVILQNMESIDPGGTRFLIQGTRGGQFRYCPLCFSEQRVPHVPIHWRVQAWRYCPLHLCQMEAMCLHCRAPTRLPTSMVNGCGGAGVAHLSDCMRCGKALAGIDPVPLDPSLLVDGDRCLLLNGRATLAALACGWLQMRSEDGHRGLTHLLLLEKRGVLPRTAMWLNPEHRRKRLRMEVEL